MIHPDDLSRLQKYPKIKSAYFHCGPPSSCLAQATLSSPLKRLAAALGLRSSSLKCTANGEKGIARLKWWHILWCFFGVGWDAMQRVRGNQIVLVFYCGCLRCSFTAFHNPFQGVREHRISPRPNTIWVLLCVCHLDFLWPGDETQHSKEQAPKAEGHAHWWSRWWFPIWGQGRRSDNQLIHWPKARGCWKPRASCSLVLKRSSI